ncbi:TlpA family protein disulfide reductase [Mucilaginibacter sp. AW1-3]
MVKFNILSLSICTTCLFAVMQVSAQTSKNTQIHYITDTAANFNSLAERFKGKAIFVDIWASWCSPCRHELQEKSVKGFQDFARKNDIVILYVCCDKDGSKWKSFIRANSLVGYHVLVNPNLDKELHTTFASVQKRNGVMKRSSYLPHHIIFDKKGMVVDTFASKQGSASVYATLKKIVN